MLIILQQHWLSVDFQRWKDEDDSSCDEESEGPGQPNFMEVICFYLI